MSAPKNRQRRGRGGRVTPSRRATRRDLEELAAVQALAFGCRCEWELKLLEHRDRYTYGQVLHDADCPAANRRGYGLVF